MDLAKDITKRQREIFEFIRGHLASHGYPPTVREIGKAVGLASSSTVHAHLANLEKLGLLRRDPTKPRAIELLVSGARRAGRAVRGGNRLPLVGSVAAGGPTLAEENIEDYVEVPAMLGGDRAEFVLRVKGDSMIRAGILDGDYVVVERAQEAADGEIVVALVGDDEATVKRFFKQNGEVRLQPENEAMEPIYSSEVRLLGRVVGVLRQVV